MKISELGGPLPFLYKTGYTAKGYINVLNKRGNRDFLY